MSPEISLSAYALSSAAALLIGSFFLPIPKLPWPRIKLRAHTEKHCGLRVVDLGCAFSWPKFSWPKFARPSAPAKPGALEFAVYFTMKV
jgi:hypothetical protein